jgi:hypothetical protein
MNQPFDIVALAKRLNQRHEEWSRLHPGQRVPVTSAMSRILENDPDYLPYRPRAAGKRQRPVTNPSVRTLVQIAAALGTTVGDLLGEPWPVGPLERRMLFEFVRMIERLSPRLDR